MTDETPGFQPRTGRHGSRWYNAQPTPEEVAAWFSSVPIHDGLNHADYVAGITLIQTTEDSTQIVGHHGDGTAMTTRVQEIVFTPYPMVETRIAYFWAYVATLPGHTGSIEPGKLIGVEQAYQLPEGFFTAAIPQTGGELVYLVGRTMRVRIKDSKGFDIACFPSEAKTVPTQYSHGAVDPDAYAKASTGAIGRALGAAGMLVLPGTGIATAEDMQAFQEGRTTPTAAEKLWAPQGEVETPASTRARLGTTLAVLMASDQRENLSDWWNDRHFPGVEALTDEQVPVALAKALVLVERSTPVEASLAPLIEAPVDPIEPVK